MGIVSGKLYHGSNLAPNTTINFYNHNTSTLVNSTSSDENANYAVSLPGPKQYDAKVDTATCTPNPLTVPAGSLIQDLTYS